MPYRGDRTFRSRSEKTPNVSRCAVCKKLNDLRKADVIGPTWAALRAASL